MSSQYDSLMKNSISHILSAYTFIRDLSLHQLLDVGNKFKDGCPIPSFEEKILIDLCKEAQEIFKNEENILNIDGDVIVVGDIHGSLHDLFRILKYIDKKQEKVLFLGDFVDRGHFSLECITLLFAMKIFKPDSFFLIRGNHEFDSLCSKYGFKKEILSHHNLKRKSEDDFLINGNENISENSENFSNFNYQYSNNLYNAFIDAFSYLPICAIVNKTSFCIHGGLCPILDNIDLIKFIHRPIKTFEENVLLTDLVWSDPSSKIASSYVENQRGLGFLFGENSTSKFLSTNSFKRIIRAHQCVKNGICEHFDKKCITVFSASSYSFDMENLSAILKINQNNDTIEYIMFPPLHRLNKSDAIYYKYGNKKSSYFSFRHPKLPFKGKTAPSLNKDPNRKTREKSGKTQRDFHSLKINCHVNPASIANSRKANFPFIHVPLSPESDPENTHAHINRSVSLPLSLIYESGKK